MKRFLQTVWEGWQRLARRLARIQTVVLITVFYFVVIVPVGALFKLFGWDPLGGRGFHSRKQSNWKKIETPSPDIESLKRQS